MDSNHNYKPQNLNYKMKVKKKLGVWWEVVETHIQVLRWKENLQ